MDPQDIATPSGRVYAMRKLNERIAHEPNEGIRQRLIQVRDRLRARQERGGER